jgi:hypothetical protein
MRAELHPFIWFRRALLSVFVLTIVCCGGGGGGAAPSQNPAIIASPAAATVASGATINVSITAFNLSNPAVTWSHQGGVLTSITPTSATWTAPSVSGVYSVTAVSISNPSLISTTSYTVISQVGNLGGNVK